ncbi:MAG: glycyl-radical enzyme activating protein [Spirochaetaceae bacterium]
MKKINNARIFDIQRFSVHDGPGIRTVVFFKGCNLKCSWCHNPESIKHKNHIEFYPDKCIVCNNCFDVCQNSVHLLDNKNIHKIDRDSCTACFKCAQNCFAEAIVGVGKDIDRKNVLENILTDRDYFNNSDGGVTFSGGESMLQIEFLETILTDCKKENIHTAIDTAGNVPWSSFERILDVTDLFLFDLKAADTNIYKKYTGVDNYLILENLKKLSENNKDIIIRIPLIIGVNENQFKKMGDILKPLNIKSVEILPYHKLGENKYNLLEMDYNKFIIPTKEQVEIAKIELKACGLNIK